MVIPEGYRSEWATDVTNSGFMLWKYQAGSGFTLSDIYTPDQSETFTYQIEQGDTIEQRYGAMVGTTPVFDPRWHFFDLEVLDDSGEPVLMVQSEAFTQLGNSYRSMPDPDIVYSVGSRFAAQDSINTIWGGGSAIQGFFIRDGLLVERQLPVVKDDAIIDVAHKRFIDLNGDGFLDITAVSGAELPSIFINDGQGTLEKVFLGDLFPDLFGDASFWQVDNWNTHGWGALFYPFYAADKLDLLYWSKGFTFNIPPWIGENYVFSPGDIVIATNNSTANLLSKKLSSEEFSVLSEVCIANGWWGKDGYQIPCRLGTPFPNNEELDTDGDGVFDNLDAFRLNSAESVDTDSDGIGNNADTDDDNDGVSDQQDNCSLVENPQQLDTDSDDSGNACDTDDDNDGVVDTDDAFPLDASESLDTDSDGTGNNADTDDDNDGVIDADDAFPLDANESLDTDGDGIGNNADTDDDNDGVVDTDDAFPLDASESLDTDSDGIGNNADTDDDNDGVVDADDAFPLISLDGRTDTDADGRPDECDAACLETGMIADNDDDGDGVNDDEDAFPLDASETMDSDSDGIGDNADAFPLDERYTADSDSDGMPDQWELYFNLDPSDPSDANSDYDFDGVSALDEFLAGTIPSLSLDVDGNRQYDALTDGLLLLRSMFGLEGDALISDTVAADAIYDDATDIQQRIELLGESADIDADGNVDALTDSLLILRYLFGLRGDTLIDSVVSAQANRTSAEDIESHLSQLTLQP
ncbi:thrombospondin type 3 repeat-containing protein [Porticoccaceae bacterium]|nr:thrombospondin type 3 repeat-containing protein [Porticoccaceae bacterium]